MATITFTTAAISANTGAVTTPMASKHTSEMIMKNRKGEKRTASGKVTMFQRTQVGHKSKVKGQNRMFKIQSIGGRANQLKGQKFQIIPTSCECPCSSCRIFNYEDMLF